MNLLLIEAQNWILPGVLLLLVIGLFVMNIFRNKKYQQNADTMTNNLKKGDKVKTYSGVYGVIIEIVQTADGKIVTIETGTEKHKSYVSYDVRAVYAINEPEPAPIEEKTEIAQNVVEEKPLVETKTEDSVETASETKIDGETVKEVKKTRKKKAE